MSANMPPSEDEPWGLCGIRLYDTNAQIVIEDVTFANFVGRADSAVLQPTMFYDFVPQGLSVLGSTNFRNVAFENKLVLERGVGHCSEYATSSCHSSQNANVIDTTGSFVGSRVPTLWGAGNDICRTGCQTHDWWKLDD